MKKLASRSAQYPLYAEFAFGHNDWVVDSADGSKKTFGSTVPGSVDPTEQGLNAGTAVTFDCIPMPVGAVITGGEVIFEQAFVGIGAAATLSIGIAGTPAALISALDLDAAATGSRAAFALTSALLCNNGQNIRISTAGLTATATAGKARIRVQYTIDGRSSEVQVS